MLEREVRKTNLLIAKGGSRPRVDLHGPSLRLTFGWNSISIQEAEDFAASLGESWHVHSHAS